jgi:ElaB/YqjD/DUF883 family membrane-anchored ribosome-binding protein
MAATTTNEEVDALKEDISRLREDIANLASAVLDDAKEKVNSKSQKARSEFTGKMNEGIDRGKQFMDDLDAQVSRNPVGSILVAFGVGVLVAKILGSGNGR